MTIPTTFDLNGYFFELLFSRLCGKQERVFEFNNQRFFSRSFLGSQYLLQDPIAFSPMTKPRQLRDRLLVASDSEDEASIMDESEDNSQSEDSTTKNNNNNNFGAPEKVALLNLLEPEGGVKACTKASSLLADTCAQNTQLFGGPQGTTPRNRRKQVSNFIDKFKRRNPTAIDIAKARQKLIKKAKLEQQQPATKAKAVPIKKEEAVKKVAPPPSPPVAELKVSSKPTFACSLSKLTSPIKPTMSKSSKSRTSSRSKTAPQVHIPPPAAVHLRPVLEVPEDARKYSAWCCSSSAFFVLANMDYCCTNDPRGNRVRS